MKTPLNQEADSNIRKLKVIRERRKSQFGRATIVGLLAGAFAVLFQKALFFMEHYRNGLLSWLHIHHSAAGWLVLPVLAALLGGLAAYITSKYAPEAAGSGIPHIKGALYNVRRVHWRRLLPVKFLGGLLAIGSGFSLGREGPTVQIGAAAGGMVSEYLHARPRARKHLIACGAGAGLAAAFNAPLAGFIFVIEELQRDLSPITYGTALISSVLADIITRAFMGQTPAFHIRDYPMLPLSALPIAAILGIVCGFLGPCFNQSLLWTLKKFNQFQYIRPCFQAALVGMIIGLVAWQLPQAIGSGHGTAEAILQGGSFGTTFIGGLFVLFLLKWFFTLICYSSGVPGGIFAPMLVLGALQGIAIGKLFAIILPVWNISPAALAVVGMAAFFTSTVRAPLTGIILILEMTSNYDQLFSLLVACMLSFVIAERFHSKPIYDSLLEYDMEKQGIIRPGQEELSVFEVTVEPDSALCDKYVRNANLPEGCLLISIRRGAREIIPHGNSKLAPGDMISVLISMDTPEAYAEVSKLARADI